MLKRGNRPPEDRGYQFQGSKVKKTAFSLKASHGGLCNDRGAGLREGGFC